MKWIILCLSILCCLNANTQTGARPETSISGSMSLTNNGISFVPNFSLEQPAALLNLTLEKGRFSFEPEFTFSLEEGRAWYQVYWLRYKILNEGKLRLRAGGHLGLNFAKILDASDNEVIKTERYLVAELAPSYEYSESSSVGLQYMIARGYDIVNEDIQHFLSLNAHFSNIKISESMYLEISPQVFYLATFGPGKGYYAATGIKISKTNFPLSFSTVMNKTLSSDIAGKDFLWNMTLTYNFRKGKVFNVFTEL